MDKNTKIGFIGTGVMGASMAGHIQKAGYPVAVYNRTKARALPLTEAGALWQESPAALARWADVVITMVGYPKDVEEVCFGADGILENARPGSYIVDMTTSKPSLAVKIYEAAKAKGLHAVDAPVSGGDIGARNATLAIMAGGDREDFQALLPIFQVMGKNIALLGGAGFGQHTKMCNQIAIAGAIMGVCESLVYAEKAGLEPKAVVDCIATGGAGSAQMNLYTPRILAGDFKPGFYIKHFVKDMGIAIEEAEAMGLKLPALALAKTLYDRLVEDGKGDLGTQALYLLYAQMNGLQ